MVEVLGFVIYFNTSAHTRYFWVRSVDAAHAFFILGAKYSTLWKMVEIGTRDLRSRWLRIRCQTTNDLTKSLNWWLKPHNLLYILTIAAQENGLNVAPQTKEGIDMKSHGQDTQLRQKGLCLVPISILLNYINWNLLVNIPNKNVVSFNVEN